MIMDLELPSRMLALIVILLMFAVMITLVFK